jgi:hypothetical protein
MNLKQANEQVVQFFGGRKLTFCIERFGENNEEWIARCDQIPAISTSGYGFDERDIRDQVRDAILTAAGVDGEYADEVLNEFSLTNELAISV